MGERPGSSLRAARLPGAVMSTIELRAVRKAWGSTPAVNGLSFVADEGKFLVLLGPSGCGKSTTLRLIAGLEEPTAGLISIEGRDVTHMAPSERQISMVFQSYALFPHLNVAENILFGLKVRRVSAAERERRLIKVVHLVGLGGLMDRKPAQLSGGQRQRVALARAIIAENRICLMDEPLSNLDAKLRHEMRMEIRALQRRLGMTVVYVTHDQTEAMSMADKVILMREGCIEQEGAPDLLYSRPATEFAAQFIGSPPMNVLELAEDFPFESFPSLARYRSPETGRAAARVGVRPEDLELAATGIPVELVSADYLGADSIVAARFGDETILVRRPGHIRVTEGEQAHLHCPAEALHVFDARTGRRMEQ